MTIRSLRLIVCLTVSAFAVSALAADQALLVKAGRVDLGNGQSIENAAVLIQDGVITAVGPDLVPPDGAKIIDLPDGVITPGLIDAAAIVADERNDLTRASTGFSGHDNHAHSGCDHESVWSSLAGPRQHAACCGSSCPRVLEHADGQPCKYCGFPDAAPQSTAVGVEPWHSTAEQSAEVVPHLRVLDAIDLDSRDFNRLAESGVTTVFITPDSASVIGARAAIVRTGGPQDARVINPADAVKATFGSDPSYRGAYNQRPWRQNVSLYARRPTTRMGVTWVFRKAMYEATARMNGQPLSGGADTPSDPALDALGAVLNKKTPLRIQARTQVDITTALRLTEEFALDFTLEEATDAYRCATELAARSVPVVYGPIFADAEGWRAVFGEVENTRLATPRKLIDHGIKMALTASDMRDEQGLAAQAMYSMRFGLSYDEALAAVTETPARILGIADRTGTLESGKSADLVLWTGQPFQPTTRPAAVVIAGQVIAEKN